jgi:hypothetical protein
MGVIIIVLISSAAMLPYLAVSFFEFEPPLVLPRFPGVPVAETVFSALVSDQLDPVMFPGGPVEETETSIRMESNYTDLPHVNESVAEDAAREMVSHFPYLDGISFTFNHVWSRLEDAAWYLKMESSTADVFLRVNALTATVTDFTPVWKGVSPLKKDPSMVEVLNDSQVLEHGLEFLQFHNYSLSGNAWLVGPLLESSLTQKHQVFIIKFFHVVNDVVVWYSTSYNGVRNEFPQISIELDIETGQVLSFRYLWTHVPEIPLQNIIGPEEAVDAALEYLRDEKEVSEVNVIPFSLVFEHWRGHQLNWKMYTNHSLYQVMSINAKSAEIAGISEAVISTTIMTTDIPQYIVPEPPLFNVVPLLLLSIVPATIAYLVLRHRIREGYLP